MNLGGLLSQSQSIPIIDWPVTFHFAKPGQKERIIIDAFILPVSEADRARSRFEALQFLKTSPSSPFYKIFQKEEEESQNKRGGFKSSFEIPVNEISLEQQYKFLAYALYTKDEAGNLGRLVKNEADYTLFREGIIFRVLDMLYERYNELIDQEYPETLSKEKQKELEEEALKKS